MARARRFSRSDPPDALVAVDPGTTNLGIALFEQGVLTHVGYLRKPGARDILDWVDQRLVGGLEAGKGAVWVREKMRKYPDRPTTHKDLDQIEALAKATALAGRFKWAAAYYAMTWKRNVPKAIHHPRLAHVLDEDEKRIFSQANSDGKDAVGIGLFALRRTGPGGRLS